ncbi:integrin beta-3-like [Mizuhopecten yessoensis]|uniref:Integrin beta-3 n=1 Tax=Mizuhopecten yessoensis TaxID=6573 RepID=A0A210R4I6_MIZYE|nr:integrin beta-3-like [Mizuhopecten yessoensis]OWF55818.1 Integrin beta-3 [Mizuhopecten yessoensis]
MGLCRLTCWIVAFGVVGHLALTQTPPCHGHGTLNMGMCVCDQGYIGVNCSLREIDQCKASGANSVCSGHGDCIDGMCLCQSRGDDLHRFSGTFCECDDHSCPYFEDEVCGGHDRGWCECGTCRCNSGFLGEDCSCPTAIDRCTADDGRICSGNGNCRCNRCVCINGYMGPTCSEGREIVPKQSSSKSFMSDFTDVCNLWIPCVLCVGFNSGEKDVEECEEDCSINRIHMVDALPDTPDNRVCRHKDTDQCMVTFSHTDQSFYAMSVYVQQTKKCPPPTLTPEAGVMKANQLSDDTNNDDDDTKDGSSGSSKVYYTCNLLYLLCLMFTISVLS